MCDTLLSEKEPRPSSSSRFTRLRSHSIILATALMERTVFLTSSFSSGVTRSTLLRRILSAKATCCTASFTTPSSRTSSRCCLMCLASTTHRIASTRYSIPTSGLELKVKATGAGSAMPVVSMMTLSYFSGRCNSVSINPSTNNHQQIWSHTGQRSLAPSQFVGVRLSPRSQCLNIPVRKYSRFQIQQCRTNIRHTRGRD
mmetsp:Transcript_85838/g.228821  ORF Transcript_85838/g.228821 Transcript_85838/m.228821 type:complete len:200 (-) Transcript_85838:936-1535(-)